MKPAALVTGASRGLGAAIAERLAADGFPVFLHFHARKDLAEALAARISSAGGKAATGQADLSRPEAPKALAEAARAALGPVGVLVHSAGGPVLPKPLASAGWEEAARALDLGPRAAWGMAQALHPDMARARWGRIVTLGSAYLWDAPPPGMGAYVTAKQALLAWTRAAAVEWGPDGITANCVSPSLVPTDLTAHLPEAFKGALARQTPLRRLAAPADVAGMVSMLCSTAGDFVTGAHLPVTGGWRMP